MSGARTHLPNALRPNVAIYSNTIPSATLFFWLNTNTPSQADRRISKICRSHSNERKQSPNTRRLPDPLDIYYFSSPFSFSLCLFIMSSADARRNTQNAKIFEFCNSERKSEEREESRTESDKRSKR